MKFRATRADLAAAVADAARALPSRPSVPVLNTVRVTASANEGEVEVVGYDFDVCIRATLPAVVVEAGVALVPGRVFAASLAGMPHGDVAVEQVGSRLEVKMPRVRYGLSTVAPEDYPGLPPTPAAIGTFDAGALTRALAKAAVAARPVVGLGFTGAVQILADSEQLTFVATDRYSVAVTRIPWQAGGPTEAVSALVGARALADALKGMTGEVSVCIDSTGIAVLGAERTMSSRRLDTEFPTWQAVVDSLAEPTTRIRVQAEQLAEAMARAARLPARGVPVRLTVSEDEGLSYDLAADGESELTGDVDAHVTGDPVVIGLNPVFMADALKAAGPVVVEVAARGPHKPLTVVDPENPADVHVVMPVRLP